MDAFKIGLIVCAVVLMGLIGTDCKKCKRTFSYNVANVLKEPYFKEHAILNITCRQTPLIRYMEDSVLEFPKQFSSFQATFTSPYGYFVDAMNGRTANFSDDKTYWSILNQDGFLDKGVSSYIPQAGDQILFNLTKYTGTHP